MKERRHVILRMSPERWVRIAQAMAGLRGAECHRVPKLSAWVPDDVECRGVYYSPAHHSLDFLLEYPSFELLNGFMEAPIVEEPLDAEIATVEVVPKARYERLKEELFRFATNYGREEHALNIIKEVEGEGPEHS